MMENDSDQSNLPKFPFKRIERPLQQIINTAIVLHIESLKQQSESIERLKGERYTADYRGEQIKVNRTVQLLKSDLSELESLNLQVRDEDQDLFHKAIREPVKNVIEVLTNFTLQHSDVLGPILEVEGSLSEIAEGFSGLQCDLSEPGTDLEEDFIPPEDAVQLQVDASKLGRTKETLKAWEFLQKELLEINSLIRHFSQLVFRQRDDINTIQSNINDTRDNVTAGNTYLKKANLLKAATLPITGAVIGGLVLGPIGVIAGFKLFGSMACVAGGSVACVAGIAGGYNAGVKLKNKTQSLALEDIELKQLTYPSKSISNPDLPSIGENKKDV